MIALSCWAIGAWVVIQPGLLSVQTLSAALAASGAILASIMIAVGIAFWLIGNDRRAGVAFDRKGLLLNLGPSASFVAWDNIATLGICQRYSNLLALGSSSQLGITLRDPAAYLQSYETRLPASQGPLAAAVRVIERLLRHDRVAQEPTVALIAARRRRLGYDIVIPETQLGGSARAFIALIDAYRTNRG